jgi:hypothetical protein
MRAFSIGLTLLLLSSTVLFAGVLRPGTFQGASDGSNVTLYWSTEDEANVAKFEIERRSGSDGAFMLIGSTDPGAGPNYEFVDNSAFRKIETLYQYRLKIVFSNGAAPVYSTVVSVSHTVSGIRRTWGSIKALFH